MSRSDKPYNGIPDGGFQQAIVHLLETEYKLVGSRKVIKMIADDIDQLHREYYPDKHKRCPGEIIWRTTSIEQGTPRKDETIEDHETTTVCLPYLTEEDLDCIDDDMSVVEHDKIRIKRLAVAAYQQGGMLNHAELGAIMNRSRATISRRIQKIQKEEDRVLPLKGTLLDMGPGTSHKGIILRLYEQNVEPPEIARRTYHELSSVDRYINDYERIKMLKREGLDEDEIRRVTGKSKSLFEEYQAIIEEYYPELKTSDSNEKSE